MRRLEVDNVKPNPTASDTDARNQPVYGITEAARYLRLPPTTLASWVRGQSYKSHGYARKFRVVIELPDPKVPLLSFLNFVEAHVLAALRRKHNVALPKVRTALDFVSRELKIDHPLANVRFETDGIDLFVQHLGGLVSASQQGQIAMRSVLEAYLKRVERDTDGRAVRLFLFTRTGGDESRDPKIIVVDPSIAFGRPVIARRAVATSVVAERYRAGEGTKELADDYGCKPEEIEEAVRCEFAQAA